MSDRNAKVLGKAATPEQLSELALFECEVVVTHIRPIVRSDTADRPWGTAYDLHMLRKERDPDATFATQGGRTFVRLTIDPLGCFGEARCRSDENFCRREGVEIALKRAMRKLPGGEADAEEVKVPVIRPHTPREALLMIRAECAGTTDTVTVGEIDEIAQEGLAPREPATFELTDHLADRLAEAHHMLRKIRAAGLESPTITRGVYDEIGGVLALPPDLESMVERRVPRG